MTTFFCDIAHETSLNIMVYNGNIVVNNRNIVIDHGNRGGFHKHHSTSFNQLKSLEYMRAFFKAQLFNNPDPFAGPRDKEAMDPFNAKSNP